VWHDMLAEGISCGVHRIERLMRLQALKARPRRRRQSWSRLSEQFFRFDKWSLCRG